MAVSGEFLTQVSIGAVALYTLVTAASRAIDRLLALAEYYDVDEVLVGMTVLAVGTSLPEIVSHLVASMGIVSQVLDYGTLRLTPACVRGSYLPMLGAIAATLAVAWDGTIGRFDGFALVALYVAYVLVRIRGRERTPSLREPPSLNPRRDAVVATGLLVLVVLSASLLLTVVEVVVDSLALGGSMVGVVTLGVAAALPELSTVMDAIRRRSPHVALGTLVGSNIVNPLVGIGLGGAISTYYVPTGGGPLGPSAEAPRRGGAAGLGALLARRRAYPDGGGLPAGLVLPVRRWAAAPLPWPVGPRAGPPTR